MKTLSRSLLALALLAGANLTTAAPVLAGGCCDSWRADEDDARYGCYGRYYYSCGGHHYRHYGHSRGYGYGYGHGYGRWTRESDRTTTRCNAFRCATYRCDGSGRWCEQASPSLWRR